MATAAAAAAPPPPADSPPAGGFGRQPTFGRPSAGRGAPPTPPAPHAEAHRIPEACHGPAGLSKHHEEVPIKACLVPKELYEHIVEAGATKAKWRLDKQVVMGLLAGFYIGFSFTFMMVIGGQVSGIASGREWSRKMRGGREGPADPSPPRDCCPACGPARQSGVTATAPTHCRRAHPSSCALQIPEVQHGENPGFYNLVLGAFGFPLGLFMICVVGADLFTSDCSYMMTAVFEGRASVYSLVKVRCCRGRCRQGVQDVSSVGRAKVIRSQQSRRLPFHGTARW